MAITKEKKQAITKELADKLAKQKSLIFADFSGLKVKDLSELKKKLKAAGAEFKVAKKTLIDLAFKNSKIDIGAKNLAGQIALIFGYTDEVAPAKIIYEFGKTNEHIKILGGYLRQPLTIAQVESLAQMPSREQLISNFISVLSSPIRGLAAVLRGNIYGLVYTLNQIQKSKTN